MFQFSDATALTEALQSTGFGDVRVRRVEQNWHLERAEDFIESFIAGVVRGGALLAGQTPEALAAIKAEAIRGMNNNFRAGNRYAVPMPAFVGTGTKPPG